MNFNAAQQAAQAQAAQNAQYAQMAGMVLSGVLAMSSAAIKSDITPVDGGDALDALMQTKVSKWRYMNDDVYHVGPLAEQTPFAKGVGVDYGSITGSLVAAVQALTARIEELENDRAATKAQAEGGYAFGYQEEAASIGYGEATYAGAAA